MDYGLKIMAKVNYSVLMQTNVFVYNAVCPDYCCKVTCCYRLLIKGIEVGLSFYLMTALLGYKYFDTASWNLVNGTIFIDWKMKYRIYAYLFYVVSAICLQYDEPFVFQNSDVKTDNFFNAAFFGICLYFIVNLS